MEPPVEDVQAEHSGSPVEPTIGSPAVEPPMEAEPPTAEHEQHSAGYAEAEPSAGEVNVVFSTADMKQIELPSHAWSLHIPSECDHAVFMKVQEQSSSSQPLVISHALTIYSNMTWKLSVHGHDVTTSAPLQMLENVNVTEITRAISSLETLSVCPGHPDPHFVDMVSSKKGKVISPSGNVAAYIDCNAAVTLKGQTFGQTVRSSNCKILVPNGKCSACVTYRDSLRAMHHKWTKRQDESPSKVTSTHSHVNERWLNTPQKKTKLARVKLRLRASEKKSAYMKEKIKEILSEKAVEVDNQLHEGLNKIMDENARQVHEKYEEGSFHRLFWDEQTSNMAKFPTQRRWHPMLIRWCLHLRMLSSRAYDAVRNVLSLPSGRTLQDYTHFIQAGVGIQTEVTDQLLSNVKMSGLEDYQKYVSVVFDEVKIKEGMIYDKHDCRIIGFVDLGGVNSSLESFERSLSQNSESVTPSSVAKQMLVFMVRGLFIKLCFPYAQYPTRGITADSLFPVAWEVIRHLESVGFKVVSLTGDKASPNQKFFRLHGKASGESNVTYKVPNPYTKEDRPIFFISDVPHLIKTVRNCWSNSFGHSQKRALWVSVYGECMHVQ